MKARGEKLGARLRLVKLLALVDARKAPGEYRNNVAKDKPVPLIGNHLIIMSTPRPNVSVYGEDVEPEKKEKSQVKGDFEPRPNVSAYGEDVEIKKEEKSQVKGDFEPRPNVSAYNEDVKPKKKEKSYVKGDFEPVLIYRRNRRCEATKG
ncbi:organ-specific protein S2-like [Andrographis paniculata]|uniref:organ-specific protein S2-like n=1 Tax=Andrographis paniculata TaxID=175694 RepID=UPI0021E987D0|nr:organ-specific protein S2-like [Andrographis paniculata]